jgi:hypothetical protein
MADAWLCQGTDFGTLKTHEIYVYYDMPLLFSCFNEKGEFFLVLNIDADWVDGNSRIVWIYAPITEATLKGFEDKDCAARTRHAILNAPGGIVYKVVETSQSYVTAPIPCSDIPSEWLPKE